MNWMFMSWSIPVFLFTFYWIVTGKIKNVFSDVFPVWFKLLFCLYIISGVVFLILGLTIDH